MRHALHPFPYSTRRTVGFRFAPPVDSLFNDLISQFDEPVLKGDWTESGLSLTVDLPGVPAEGIDVAVADRLLTVTVDDLNWKRSLRLRSNLDADSISARHLDGRLTITIGLVPAPEARTIGIDTTAPAAEAIEVGSDDVVADEVGEAPAGDS